MGKRKIIQALLANTVEFGQLSSILTKNKKQYVFLNVGSLSLVSIISNQGSTNVEGGSSSRVGVVETSQSSFLIQRMCLELIFDTLSPSYHHGLYIDIDLRSFLKSIIADTTYPTSRILISKDSERCIKYKM